jgi:hypothetical protein
MQNTIQPNDFWKKVKSFVKIESFSREKNKKMGCGGIFIFSPKIFVISQKLFTLFQR